MSKKYNSVMALADQAIYSFANIFNLIMLGRYGSSTELGYYSLCFSIILFAINLHESFLTMPYTVNRSDRKPANLQRYYNHVVLGFFVINLGTLLICALISLGLILTKGPEGWMSLSTAFCAGILFMTARDFIRRMLFANWQFLSALLYDSSILFIQGLAYWIVLQQSTLTAPLVLYIISLSCLIPSCIWLVQQKKLFHFSLNQFYSDLQSNWTMGKWLFSATLMMWLSRQCYPWLLVWVHGPQAAGIYAACWSFAQFARPFLKGLGNYWVPSTALTFRENPLKFQRKINQLIAITTSISIFPTLILLILGNEILTLVYGPEFTEHVSVVYALALYIPAMAVSYIFIVGFKSMKKPEKNFSINVMTFLISMVCCYFLIGPYGPLGAALSLLIGDAVGIAIRYAIFKHTLGIELNGLSREYANT